MIGRPNCDPVLGVVEGVLVRGPGDAERLRADRRPGQLERAHRGLAARGPLPVAGPGEALVERVLAAEQAAAGHPDVVEEDVGGVRGAQPELAQLLAAVQARRCPGGTTNAACPREPSSGSTTAVTTCTLAMPPLVAYAFCPLRTHSSVASS